MKKVFDSGDFVVGVRDAVIGTHLEFIAVQNYAENYKKL